MLDRLLDRRSSRLRRNPASSPFGMTFRTSGTLITVRYSEPFVYSLKVIFATNMSGVVLDVGVRRTEGMKVYLKAEGSVLVYGLVREADSV